MPIGVFRSPQMGSHTSSFGTLGLIVVRRLLRLKGGQNSYRRVRLIFVSHIFYYLQTKPKIIKKSNKLGERNFRSATFRAPLSTNLDTPKAECDLSRKRLKQWSKFHVIFTSFRLSSLNFPRWQKQNCCCSIDAKFKSKCRNNSSGLFRCCMAPLVIPWRG